ncbi:MAG: FMN-binding negative transcriptional regulator [Sphingobium sp.]
MSSPFEQWNDDDLADLIAANPLAWITPFADPAIATPMPVLLIRNDDGKPTGLLGHLPKRHPMVSVLTADQRALFLFQGPHSYISPAWIDTPDWAPTWNFAVARVEASVAFDDGLTDQALTHLVDHMEKMHPSGWTISGLGDRYNDLKARVIGFSATISSVTARFKLGQDERPEIFEQIVSGLGDDPLVQWMRRFASRN